MGTHISLGLTHAKKTYRDLRYLELRNTADPEFFGALRFCHGLLNRVPSLFAKGTI